MVNEPCLPQRTRVYASARHKRANNPRQMPTTCPESPHTPMWVYPLLLALFALAVATYWGLVQAQKRVYPDEARLYSTPVPPHILHRTSSDLSRSRTA